MPSAESDDALELRCSLRHQRADYLRQAARAWHARGSLRVSGDLLGAEAALPAGRGDHQTPLWRRITSWPGLMFSPGAAGVTVLGMQPAAPVPVGSGCYLHTDFGLPWALLDLWLAGHTTHTFLLAIPDDPALLGVQVALQSWVLPTDAPLGLDLSNGVSFHIGR